MSYRIAAKPFRGSPQFQLVGQLDEWGYFQAAGIAPTTLVERVLPVGVDELASSSSDPLVAAYKIGLKEKLEQVLSGFEWKNLGRIERGPLCYDLLFAEPLALPPYRRLGRAMAKASALSIAGKFRSAVKVGKGRIDFDRDALEKWDAASGRQGVAAGVVDAAVELVESVGADKIALYPRDPASPFLAEDFLVRIGNNAPSISVGDYLWLSWRRTTACITKGYLSRSVTPGYRYEAIVGFLASLSVWCEHEEEYLSHLLGWLSNPPGSGSWREAFLSLSLRPARIPLYASVTALVPAIHGNSIDKVLDLSSEGKGHLRGVVFLLDALYASTAYGSEDDRSRERSVVITTGEPFRVKNRQPSYSKELEERIERVAVESSRHLYESMRRQAVPPIAVTLPPGSMPRLFRIEQEFAPGEDDPEEEVCKCLLAVDVGSALDRSAAFRAEQAAKRPASEYFTVGYPVFLVRAREADTEEGKKIVTALTPQHLLCVLVARPGIESPSVIFPMVIYEDRVKEQFASEAFFVGRYGAPVGPNPARETLVGKNGKCGLVLQKETSTAFVKEIARWKGAQEELVQEICIRYMKYNGPS